jgi:glutathione synthase/RimK-type ligase-like ATP-grasp enzyme
VRSPITILTNERDFAADAVIRHLNELGTEVRRLNFEEAHSGPTSRWDPVVDRSPSVVWWRQFETETQPTSLIEAENLIVERAQWRTWLSTLHRPGSLWINDLWAARRAENKIEQLRASTYLGFSVPPTLVTNSRVDAQRFADEHGEAVVKTLSSGYFPLTDHAFVFTESFSHEALADERAWYASPLMVQKRLLNSLDARIVSFADHTFGAKCEAPGLDWRKTPDQRELWQHWDVAPEVAALCASYRRHFGLHYAAFDFMIDEHEIWFLEANQAGEFSFLDRALDLGISRAFADALVAMVDVST